MDEGKLTSLRAYYESLADDALLSEAALGRDAFAAEAWDIVSREVERRGLRRHPHRHGKAPHGGVAAEPKGTEPGFVERFAARIDALPPSLKPAAFGATVVVMFAMARGAVYLVPVLVVYVLATSPDPWSTLMTAAGIFVLAMLGGALSGFAYSLLGRRLRTAFPGGYYLTGIVTLAPYMFLLTYIARLTDGIPLWHRPRVPDFAISGFMTLLFGVVVGRAWFGPDDEGEHPTRATSRSR
jgi:hypothetical protein